MFDFFTFLHDVYDFLKNPRESIREHAFAFLIAAIVLVVIIFAVILTVK